MIPAKEKAEELVEKYSGITREYEEGYGYSPNIENAKICALIEVDEIDDIYQKLTPKDNPYYFLFQLEYWQEVKQEIELL